MASQPPIQGNVGHVAPGNTFLDVLDLPRMKGLRASAAPGLRRLPVTAGVLLGLAMIDFSCSVVPPARINDIYSEVLQQRHDQYKLKDGDTLVVKLYNREGDLNQTGITVLPDGRSDVFFMDGFKFAGKTLREAEAELKRQLAGEVRNPESTEVSIQAVPRGERVHLIGEFERPGTFEMTTRLTLREAISMAGGMKVTGDTDYALLSRPFMDPRHPDSYRIDLNDESEQIFLLPGDQIILGRTWLATVVVYLQSYLFAIFGPPSTGIYNFAAYGAGGAAAF